MHWLALFQSPRTLSWWRLCAITCSYGVCFPQSFSTKGCICSSRLPSVRYSPPLTRLATQGLRRRQTLGADVLFSHCLYHGFECWNCLHSRLFWGGKYVKPRLVNNLILLGLKLYSRLIKDHFKYLSIKISLLQLLWNFNLLWVSCDYICLNW